MNKNLYRIIFNKARGLLMVVSEINRGRGKSGANGVGHTLSQLIGSMKPAAFLTMTALGFGHARATGAGGRNCRRQERPAASSRM